jgi:hypothetical protein
MASAQQLLRVWQSTLASLRDLQSKLAAVDEAAQGLRVKMTMQALKRLYADPDRDAALNKQLPKACCEKLVWKMKVRSRGYPDPWCC